MSANSLTGRSGVTPESSERDPKRKSPLDGRPGLRTINNSILAKELGLLATRAGLLGCVLISFSSERIGINSCGRGRMSAEMQIVGDRLLAMLDDGVFDPEMPAALSTPSTGATQEANEKSAQESSELGRPKP